MKKTHIYSCAAALLAIALLISFIWNKKWQEPSVGASSTPAGVKNDVEIAPQHVDQVQGHISQKVNTFIEEMSRELCKQEQAAISEIVWPDIKTLNSLKPGDAVPESNVVLNPAQAIEVLKRMSISKCSSFRKDNSERFFAEFVLTPENYREFYSHINLIRGNGLDTYKLIKKALESLDRATGEEAKQLRHMILYSLKTSIKDSHSFVDVGSAVSALRDIRKKDLISYPTAKQIEVFQEQVVAISKSRIQESQRLIRKYFPRHTDFLKLTEEEIFNAHGYQGIKEELKKEQRDFAIVKDLAQQLNYLVGENF